jgi:uncharacterized protein
MLGPDERDKMLTTTEILALLREHKPILAERFSVRRIGVFGSYAHGKAEPESDIDALVEMDAQTFDHYMDLKFYLEELFQKPVDLVLADTLKPRIKPYVEHEVLYA